MQSRGDMLVVHVKGEATARLALHVLGADVVCKYSASPAILVEISVLAFALFVSLSLPAFEFLSLCLS